MGGGFLLGGGDYIRTYMYIERDAHVCKCVYVYIYIYIYTHTYMGSRGDRSEAAFERVDCLDRRYDEMCVLKDQSSIAIIIIIIIIIISSSSSSDERSI